jgi:Cof subfamily protein (haloacid dehalogenase superfamily)
VVAGGHGQGRTRQTVRLVACDLDGTLLLPDATVSARSLAAIGRLRQAGIAFLLVTGRPPRSVREIAARAGLGGMAVCANGALVYDLDAGQVLTSTPLASGTGRRLVRELRRALPGVLFAAEDERGFRREAAWEGHGLDAVAEVVHADPVDLVAEPVAKLLLRHPELAQVELVERVRELASDRAVVTYSGDSLVEISAAGVTKAYALDWVCRRLGIPAAAVVAFGDMPNDLPMLAWAGHAVAVANARPEVREAADEVTASNLDDGVALVLERLVGGVEPA